MPILLSNWQQETPFTSPVGYSCLFPEGGMIKKLIRCSKCNQVIPIYEGSSVAQDQSLPGVEWSNADLAKAKEFLRTHSGHLLEELSIESDSLTSEKPDYEPIRVTYILASNSRRREFLIRRTRTALDQSASYEIIHGKLKLSNAALKIQEYELRKQIAECVNENETQVKRI